MGLVLFVVGILVGKNWNALMGTTKKNADPITAATGVIHDAAVMVANKTASNPEPAAKD